MTKHIPPTEAFDDQEREVARIVRALPGGEPSPALDARILRSAANAAAARRPTAQLIASAGTLWGIGGAAAAVLALGVAWQALAPGPRAPGEAVPTAATMSDRAESSEEVTVQLNQSPASSAAAGSEPFPAPPPAPTAGISKRVSSRAAAPTPAAAPPARAPAPPPPPPAPTDPAPFQERFDEHVSDAAAPVVAAQAESASSALARDEVGNAAKSSSDSTSAARQSRAQAELGAGAAAPEPESLPMAPANWLQHIRRLRDGDQLEEARTSLVQFRKRYPNFVVPSDLAPLLRE